MALFKKSKKAFLRFFHGVCPGCGASMEPQGTLLCPWCAIRIYPDGERVIRGKSVLTAFHHAGIPRDLVIRLKFGGERKLAPVIAALCLSAWRDFPGRGDTVIPVPTTSSRIRKRGYNQAELIAKAVTRTTGAVCMNLLKRERGDSQVGLTAEERARNIRGKFSLSGRPEQTGRIWVLDDVMTTGATMLECIAVLEDAGMEKPSAAVVCFRKTEDESIIQGKEEYYGGV